MVQEGHFGHNEMVMESPVADTPHGPQNHGAISGQSKRRKAITVELEEEENTSSEPLRKHHKRLRHGGLKIDCSVLIFDTECLDAPREPLLKEGLQALVPRSQAEIDRNCRQLDFWRQSIEGVPGPSASYDYCSSALDSNSRENCLVTAATGRNLHFHVGDWLGRLTFSPSRGLMIPAPKPFFCFWDTASRVWCDTKSVVTSPWTGRYSADAADGDAAVELTRCCRHVAVGVLAKEGKAKAIDFDEIDKLPKRRKEDTIATVGLNLSIGCIL